MRRFVFFILISCCMGFVFSQSKYYVWNDGRGIVFSVNDEGFYVPKTNSYRFPTDTKVLEIKYKVLLPTKGFNERDLEKQLPSAGFYTATYRKKVELK